MKDGFGRTIDYLRISLTDKCNLRCKYCMPPDGIKNLPHQEILTYEEIIALVKVMSKMGLKKIRLTGGEPLVRKNIVHLVSSIKKIEGIEEICLTTNGMLFDQFASDLKEAGLSRVNFSLDTLNEETFSLITGNSGIEMVLKNIFLAQSLSFPVKINCVPTEWNKTELCDIANLAKENPIDVRFIELMPIGCAFKMKGLSSDSVRKDLEKKFGELIPLEKNSSPSSPAKLYKAKDFVGRIGFISPISHAFCSQCNRLRLTADGMLKLCLCFDDSLDVKKILRSNLSPDKMEEVLEEEIQQALERKPGAHTFNQQKKTLSRMMTQIGG